MEVVVGEVTDKYPEGRLKDPSEYILFYPEGTKRRVVCAACRYPDGTMLVGPRHWDNVMRIQCMAMQVKQCYSTAIAGFLDQRGVFMDRWEALEVAKNADQLLDKTVPYDRLFTEDLY